VRTRWRKKRPKVKVKISHPVHRNIIWTLVKMSRWKKRMKKTRKNRVKRKLMQMKKKIFRNHKNKIMMKNKV